MRSRSADVERRRRRTDIDISRAPAACACSSSTLVLLSPFRDPSRAADAQRVAQQWAMPSNADLLSKCEHMAGISAILLRMGIEVSTPAAPSPRPVAAYQPPPDDDSRMPSLIPPFKRTTTRNAAGMMPTPTSGRTRLHERR